MKIAFKKRILPLILCISILLPMLAQVMPSVSVAATAVDTAAFEANVGKQAVFDWWTDFLLIDEETLKNSTSGELADYYYADNWVLYDDIPAGDLVLEITEYFYDAENGDHWYKLGARDGETLPAVLQERPWVYYANDADFEEGKDPYLAVFGDDDTVRIVYFTIDGTAGFRFVLSSASADIADATVAITGFDGEYPSSNLASLYGEEVYWTDAYQVQITKANGEAWTEADGDVAILYTKEMVAIDTGDDGILYGGAFLYVGDTVYSAAVTDKNGYESSDTVYTNSGSSVIVFEFLLESFEFVNEKGYFTNSSVTLYDNCFGTKSNLASSLPFEFTVAYSFTYNGETYYWIEDDAFIGSPYFIAKAEDVTLGERPTDLGDGITIITDAAGNALSELRLPLYEKEKLTAVTSLAQRTGDVKYQWQIEYEDGKWADIYGENEKTIEISFGLIGTLLGSDGEVDIRCKATDAAGVAYSDAIPIIIEMYYYEEPEVTVSESFVTSSGETVNVSVACIIPEDASVRVEETDGSGVEIADGEKVAMALDISIENADGTEWQPESGESVTVTLEASKIGLENGDQVVVYHLHDDTVKVLGTYEVVDGFISFEVDGFSLFVFAVEEDGEYDELIGKYATFNAYNEWIGEGVFDYFWLKEDPSSADEDIYTWSVYDDDFTIDQVVEVNAYYIDTEKNLWIQAVPVNGLELPQSLKERSWIYVNNLEVYDPEYDTLFFFEPEDTSDEDITVLDKYGLSVWELYFYSDEKSSITARTNLTGEVKYQWEACYDTDNLLWTAIEGETSATMELSFGKISGVLQESEWAAIRCVASNAVETVASNVIIARVILSDNVTFSADGEAEKVIVISTSVPEGFSFEAEDESKAEGSLSSGSTGSEGVMPIDEGETTPPSGETVVITLKAQHEDEEVIFQTGYQLEYGGSVSQTAEIPYIKGYDLCDANGNKIPLDTTGNVYKYTVDVANVTESYDIILTYKPGMTTYTVTYYLQNVADENYTQDGAPVVIEGITGDMIDINNAAFAKNYEGFYQLLFESAEIASDGSTDIEVFYDRLYYKMLFNLDGGYGVQPVYARYGTPVSVDNPTKAGYAFVGWDFNKGWTEDVVTGNVTEWDLDNDTAANIEQFTNIPVPAYHTSYNAVWRASDGAKVTVVVWGQNADDDGYSYVSEESFELDASTGSTITYVPGEYMCGFEPHTHDATCTIICGETEHIHSLTNNCYGNLICGKTEHTEHTDACWNCGGIVAHTISCYESTDGSLNQSPVNNATKLQIESDATETDGGLYRLGSRYSGYTYYFKLGDDYYQVSSGRFSQVGGETEVRETGECGHTNLHPEHGGSCAMTCEEHAHSDACYEIECTTKVHIHSADCYDCGKKAHTHDANCRHTTTYDNSNLWVLNEEKTGSVTVSADGSTTLNVYYDRTTFTVRFRSSGGGTTYSTVTKKWGASIRTEFISASTTARTYMWSRNTNASNGPWTSFLAVMPTENRDYYGYVSNSSNTYRANYYGLKLGGTPGVAADYDVLFPIEFKYSQGLTVTKEEFETIEGFTLNESMSSDIGDSYNGAKFYYDRNSYNLVFNNYGVNEREAIVYYEAPLSNYGSESLDVSDTPSVYQSGSVTFKGWYLAPQTPNDFVFDKDGDGEEDIKPFDFATSKMPANDLILYAWWQPVEHNVTFYHSYEDMEKGIVYTAGDEIYDYDVPHGSKINYPYTPPADPENGRYDFHGWFYVNENGIETLWDFENSTVTSDVKIYAKWTSNELMPYTVRFVYKDENGNEIEIADPITGSGLAGNTKTFNAKVGSALYPGYQTRYFPEVPSHSLTIDIDDETKNVYTFYYLYRETVPYTVYYLTKDDPDNGLGTMTYEGETYYLIAETKVVEDNDNAVVTETAKMIGGYVFDDYQKRLTLDPKEGSKNVIYFFYEKDLVNGQYVVHYMTENVDGNGFDEHSSFTGKASDGSVYSVPNPPKEIEHFTWQAGYNDGTNIEKLTGTVTVGEILELWVYYLRNEYGYTVQYLDEATGNPVHEDKTGTAKWQASVTENFVKVDGYELSNEESYTIEISDDPDDNVITFWYVKDVTLYYRVIGPVGCGTVTPTEETVKAITGVAEGSAAAASSAAYKFVGWYLDQDCENPVPAEWVDTNGKIVPQKSGDVWKTATYYAKFEYNLTSLTIVKTGAGGYVAIDSNQSFLFDIYDVESGTLVTTVAVSSGTGWQVVVDGLTVGKQYRVVEKTDWSWRYTCQSWEYDNAAGTGNEAAITLGLNGTVTFTNTRDEEKWLDGDSWCNNIFKNED